MDAGPPNEGAETNIKGIISPIVKTVVREYYSIWAVPLGVVVLFLVLHALELWTLVKLLRCKTAN